MNSTPEAANCSPRAVTVTALIERYEAIFLDAYGVLVHGSGAIPGAARLVEELAASGRRWLVVSNDASQLPEQAARRYAALGLVVPAERFLMSGMLIAPWLQDNGLVGARCKVLGPGASRAFVGAAGAEVVDQWADDYDILAVCDESGFAFLEVVDDTLSELIALFEAGRSVRLVLPNPDLYYPRDERRFGIAAGSIAMIIEAVLAARFPSIRPRFDRLGKPHAPIFRSAVERVGTRRAVMVGDQLATDIRGARDFGLDTALVSSGLSRWDERTASAAETPTWLLEPFDG